MTVTLRPAHALDAGRTGWILHRFARETAWMPQLYSEAEAISFCGAMIDRGWVTVAVEGAEIQGFIARDGAEICSLYLAPGACGRGIGRALLEDAKAGEPALWLQAFAANIGAQVSPLDPNPLAIQTPSIKGGASRFTDLPALKSSPKDALKASLSTSGPQTGNRSGVVARTPVRELRVMASMSCAQSGSNS